MNERLQELLDAVARTACQIGSGAADAAGAVGKRAGALLSAAKLNIQAAEARRAADDALRQVGEMIYSTHTGHPTGSEVLLAKLQEIAALLESAAALERESARLQSGGICPACGAAARPGDVFCRECGEKL